MLPPELESKVVNLVRKFSTGLSKRVFFQNFLRYYNVTFAFRDYGFCSLEECIKTIPDLVIKHERHEMFIYHTGGATCNQSESRSVSVVNDCSSNKDSWKNVPQSGSKRIIRKKSQESQVATTSKWESKAEANGLSDVVKVRKILEGYPEGIKLSDFVHRYCINCDKPLRISYLGFDNIENFLMSIAGSVPLRIDVDLGVKTIYLRQNKDIIQAFDKAMKAEIDSYITGILIPISEETIRVCVGHEYKPFEFPSEFGMPEYVPVFTSSIANPGLLYIQLEKEYTRSAKMIYDKLEDFYSGPYSNQYRMKTADIKANVMCVALWPDDKFWYRAKILSVLSADTVQVLYVDYGTAETISNTMLRYMNERFSKLPAQCLKSRLAHLKPPNNAKKWNLDVRKRMINMCYDVPLMALMVDMKGGMPSLILCNANEKKLLCINDFLVDEGLADYDIGKYVPHARIPEQQIQQSQFLAAFAAFSTALAPMLGVGGIIQENPFLTASSSTSTKLRPAMFPCESQVPKVLSKIEYFTPELATSNRISLNRFLPNNKSCEMFQDSSVLSEESFQKVLSISKRYVKRIRSSDGYAFNMLIVESKPYISSGDMSILIWFNEEPNYLLAKLQNRKSILPYLNLTEDGNKEMFEQFERFHVKGFQKVCEKSHIRVYPLNKAVQILNMFGHPSAELRTMIKNEISSFNPHHPMWQELSEVKVPEEEECKIVTQNDKLNRLCLYDLQSMEIGIRNKKSKLINSLENSHSKDRCVDKLEHLLQKIVERIQQIKHNCSMFS